MPQPLKAATDADFLAMVPALAGYRARNSLVCVLFAGRFTGAAFRVDLPSRHRHADYRAVADAVVRLARASGADRVSPVIYTELTFESEHGIPWRDFAKLLNGRIHRSGLHIAGAFCVAADGWGSYFEPGVHPLADIESSPLLAELPPVVELDELLDLPAADPALVAGLDLAFDRLDALPDPTDHVEVCLAGEPDHAALAAFLLLSQSPSNRDAMMAQIAFGRIVGEAFLRDSAELHAVQAATGETMDELVQRQLDAGERELDELTALLWGHGRIRPEADRVRRAIGWLRAGTASVPTAMRPPLLSMLTWLSWAIGLNSAAAAYHDAAEAIDPDYGMTEVLCALLGRGVMPEWATPGADDLSGVG